MEPEAQGARASGVTLRCGPFLSAWAAPPPRSPWTDSLLPASRVHSVGHGEGVSLSPSLVSQGVNLSRLEVAALGDGRAVPVTAPSPAALWTSWGGQDAQRGGRIPQGGCGADHTAGGVASLFTASTPAPQQKPLNQGARPRKSGASSH